MTQWCEDFASSSLEDVLGQQAENRAWSKELRRRANALVNSRLANDITLDDYVANRKLAHEEAAECRRRANILESQIQKRSARS
ncbi:MAG TPA: hypothetical protein VGN17_14920 [Bryobacteraceae bacterium]|jgi:hypothetical protein